MSTAMKVRSDVAMHARFYAEGRRDSDPKKFRKLNPILFMVSAVNSEKMAEDSGYRNWTVEKFFADYSNQITE